MSCNIPRLGPPTFKFHVGGRRRMGQKRIDINHELAKGKKQRIARKGPSLMFSEREKKTKIKRKVTKGKESEGTPHPAFAVLIKETL